MRRKKNSPEVLNLRLQKIKCLNCKKLTNKYHFGNYSEVKKFCCHPCSVQYHKKTRGIGDKHYLWKGENASYITKHSWIWRHFGKANKCENNIEHKGPYQWSNISGKYKREITDYKKLCISCHRKIDHIFLYGDKCKRGHPRPTEEERIGKNGKWKECPECVKEKYVLNQRKILKRRRELYHLHKEDS